ncbi:MAG: ABC-F family ATP-binding cassette domain-containing protein [Clostridia bacterium]|nr:ABC-F family ATP-binding cassette domain-containing protein [Clostridia bacterium]
MALLSLSNVKKSFGDKLIFENVSFNIEDGHKLGFVGINGSGKTTLFKVICDELSYDSGEIFKNKSLRIGYVEQFVLNNSNNNVFDELLTIKQNLLDIEQEIEQIQNKIEELSNEYSADDESIKSQLDSLISRKHFLEDLYKENGGYTYKSIARSTLIGLGFEEKELELKVENLSGGQKTKLTLAKLLFSDSNLLLLDEPTNNLDINSIEWLENFLINYRGSFIVISHDRYFLDKVTTETIELESHRVAVYSGNYSKYVTLKAEKNKTLERQYEQTKKEINRLEKVIDQQRRWNQEHNYVTIRSKQKSIDRLEDSLVKPDEEMEKMRFHFKVIAGGNREVLLTKNLSKSFEHKKLFENVNISVLKQEKVFIVGPNGCGKTTFLKIILGQESKDSGEYVVGNNQKIAYFSQTGDEISSNQTVFDYIATLHPKMTNTEIRSALAIFLFKGEDVFKEIKDLSGGEKARISLLKIMLSESNFLILDEPTNHLDILSREALEDALMDYEGTMLIVSHDRYFINKLADKIYKIEKDGSKEFKGNYDFYIQNDIIKEETKEIKEKNTSYKEKKEREAQERKRLNRIKKIEEYMAINEEEIYKLEQLSMSQEVGSNYEKALEISNKIIELKKQNDILFEEWSILNE